MNDEEITDPFSRIQSQEMGMHLAESGDRLLLAIGDCVERLGPLEHGWTRFVKVAVIDLPPPIDRTADEISRRTG